MADFDKSEGQILDWTLLDDIGTDNPFAETPIIPRPDTLEFNLNIVVAHKDTTDSTVNNVVVTVMVRTGADDEGWRKLLEVQADAGQALTEILDANSGLGQGNPERIYVAATDDWDDGLPHWLFLLDAGNLVDSCLCFIEGWADADYYINAWDLVNAYDNADSLFDKVSQFPVRIPAPYQYAKVTFHNPDGAATYAVRVDYAQVDDIV